MTQKSARVRFPARGPVRQLLEERVYAALDATGKPRTAGPWGAVQVVLVLALVADAYAALVFWARSAWQVVAAGFVLVQGLVLVGGRIMHESVHGAVLRSPWGNRALARTLDLLGGNQSFWRHKHAVVHHTYTNIEGVDPDIDTGGVLRLHPDQPWKPHHRFQPFYGPILYSLSALHWFVSDFAHYASRGPGDGHGPAFSRAEHALFWLGKAAWVCLALVIPMLVHPPWVVLVTGLAIYLAFGLSIALLFQLAHVVDDVDAPRPARDGAMADEWAVHQLRTTVNFGTGGRFWNWYTGGLSQQIEHHLFPRVSHVHYPRIAPIVRQTCAELGVAYREHRTARAAIAAHLRHLAALGRRPAEAPAPAPADRSSTTARDLAEASSDLA